MKNLKFGLPLVNGDYYPLDFLNGMELIKELISDDWGPPPRGLLLEAKTREGVTVRISIPYDTQSAASAFIDEDT